MIETGAANNPVIFLFSRRLAFVTAEKGNALFVYDITDPTKPVWQSAIYPGAHGATWAELYNRKEIVDVDPEGMEFVSAKDSPIGAAQKFTRPFYSPCRTPAQSQSCTKFET